LLYEFLILLGADVNTASQHILGYASGINKSQAAAIIKHRIENGPFRNRGEIKNVKGIGKIAYQNAAGFLRVMDGDEPLDTTIVHPEKYDATKSLLYYVLFGSPEGGGEITEKPKKKKSARSQPLISNQQIKEVLFSQRLRAQLELCNWTFLSVLLNESVETLHLISKWISDPLFNAVDNSDIRGIKGIPPVLTRRSILAPTDFHIGLIVKGTVRNITSFGTFVDIGAEEDALLHRSQYGPRKDIGFVIGEMITCQIINIDAERGGKMSVSLNVSSTFPSEQIPALPISSTDGHSRKRQTQGDLEQVRESIGSQKRKKPKSITTK
jgi:uncharacterized protein